MMLHNDDHLYLKYDEPRYFELSHMIDDHNKEMDIYISCNSFKLKNRIG